MRGATEVLPAGTEIAGWALLIVAPVGGGLDGEAVELDVAADVVVGSNEGVGSVVDVPCAGPEAATELDGPGVASV
ncbi:MAG: hypothetical protein ABIQ39_15840, partial [Ilumatobacteraceae bacterium]